MQDCCWVNSEKAKVHQSWSSCIEDQSGDDDFMFIGCVVDKSNEWYETLTIFINNKSGKFQLDTG